MTFTLKGRNAMSGLPETTVMNSDEMIEALIEPAISIIRTVQATLEETPPELLSDIFTDGIYLTGVRQICTASPHFCQRKPKFL